MNKRVCIIQPVMKQYRIPFFTTLAALLASEGIELQVVYGTPWAQENRRNDHAELPPPLGLRVESRMLGGRLLWIPIARPWMAADLVVVEHANKNLLNFLLTALSLMGLKKVAYWGHGRDRQVDPNSGGERLKRRSLHWTNWWFAYTTDAACYVAEQGFDPARITVVQNAIDTAELRAQLAAVADPARVHWRAELGWPSDSRIAVYCGSLYENKRLDWLMEAAEQVHARYPEFRLLIAGGGPMSQQVESFARGRDWVHYAGPKFGQEKAELLSLAEMCLNPGLVGLGILDAFCARLPLLTTNLLQHGPEIEYLEPGKNGLIVPPCATAFADAIESLLNDPAKLAAMRVEAEASSHRYSIEAMAENFAAGVTQCLDQS
ncbi:glycosyltransferase family 4 protein [Thiobacillus sp.]|uniref:glycosyltransferase family 4 protein n=1 Tax=Thiobacillus sp. TaxID=924 RepID=UPI0011DA41D2|nr:glycosyltransferase family 4 protein [Thiobacillus sp.]TXH72934.1 MAG: glycosyltransferase [Thiobacillus sp.]